MADLFGRLAARTLATAPSLRPTGFTRIAPDRGVDGDVGEHPVPDGTGLARAAAPQKGIGPDSKTTVRHRGDPPSAPESIAPPPPAARHEKETRPSDDLPVAERPAQILETTPQDDLEIAERTSRSDRGAPEKQRRIETTQATPERVETKPTSSSPTTSKPSIGKPARSRPQAWEDAPLVEPSRSARAAVSEATPTTPPVAHARHPRSQHEETTVRVSIGRVEVRGPERPSPPPNPQPWSEAPMLSLGDYLRGRREGST